MNTTLNNLTHSAGAYVPSIVGALILVIVAFLIATIVRFIIGRLARALNLDRRLNVNGIGAGLDQGAFWLVILMALPGILASLGLQNVLEPIQGMLNRLLPFCRTLSEQCLFSLSGGLSRA